MTLLTGSSDLDVQSRQLQTPVGLRCTTAGYEGPSEVSPGGLWGYTPENTRFAPFNELKTKA
jgi:hypothetical protein